MPKKTNFPLLLIIATLSIPLFADERASSDKCYLYVNGYINDKNQVKEFLADKNYSLDKYSVYRRDDGQYYFTFGKMKKKLFEDLKKSGQTDGLGCTRGKGFQKRFNVNEEFKLVSGTKKLIESVEDFNKAIGSRDTDNSYAKQPTNNSSEQPINKNIKINTIDPNLLKLKEQVDLITNSITAISSLSGFQLMHPNYTDSFSLDFIALKNKKFAGTIQNLDGTISVNNSIQPKALVIYDSSNYESVDKLFGSQNRVTREEGGNLSSVSKILDILFKSGIYQQSFNELQANLINHLKSVVAEDNLFSDSNIQYLYWNDSSKINWEWNPYDSKKCWYRFPDAIDLTEYAFVLAPKSCMYERNDTPDRNFNNAIYSLRNFKGFEPIAINSNLASINYLEFTLGMWKSYYAERINQVIEAASTIDGANSGYVLLNLSNGKKLCVLESSNDIEIVSAGSFMIDENNFESVVSNKSNYSSDNDFYRAVQSGSCDNAILDIKSFLKISSLEKNLQTNFFTLNLSTIDGFFTKNEASEIYKNSYAGLTRADIDEHELVTGIKLKANQASSFAKLKQSFIQSKIAYDKNNYQIFATLAKDIYGNSYLSSIGSIVKNYQDLIGLGIDLKNTDQSASISRAIKANSKIEYSSSDQIIEKYAFIASDADLNLQQMELIYRNFSQIIDEKLIRNFNIDELYAYYKAQLKIAESENKTYADHISNVIAAEKIKREEQQKIAAERAAAERERKRKEREEYAKNYPYKIIFECHLGGSRTVLYACFGGSDSAETDIDITSGTNGYSYGYYDLASAGYNTLNEDVKSSFNVKAQLSPGSPFTLKLFVKSNATNKTLLSDSCSSAYCVLSASNYKIR